MRVFLQFASEQSPQHRSRLGYAFRLFCSIYGHQPLEREDRSDSTDVTVTYRAARHNPSSVCLAQAPVTRPLSQPAPTPISYSKDGDATYLFYQPSHSCEPDWLAEIFEWVSCADEYSCSECDNVGRVPFSASYIGRHGLNPRIPYAALAMAFLQKAIVRVRPRASLKPAPLSSHQHFVVNTHDVDFLPSGVASSSRRLAKNAAISLLLYRSPGAALSQSSRALGVALGAKDPLDQVVRLAERERQQNISASYYFLCRRGHRRDANYMIASASTTTLMHSLVDSAHMEIGVHGSYTSMGQPERLANEFAQLRELGFRPLGGRQHWLRFTMPQLLRGVRCADAAYDCSIGWPYQVGYRAGACFAFPPYDFEQEGPAPFLELPLVVMDGTILRGANHSENGPDGISEALEFSRRYGWGGISILWHPTAFGGGQYPQQVGDFYWKLASDGQMSGDTWLSAASFVRNAWQRYQNSGLLPARRWQ